MYVFVQYFINLCQNIPNMFSLSSGCWLKRTANLDFPLLDHAAEPAV